MAQRYVWLTAVLLALPGLVTAEEEGSRFEVSADLRFRLEADWDSRRSDGSERDDRTRARVRFRLGAEVELSPAFTLGMRLRTGSADSQQSPHVTVEDFDGGANGDQEILPDRLFLRYRGERAWAWAGRNAFPFWKPSEFFWDDDVQPVGVAAGIRFPAGELEVAVSGAGLALPDGGYDLHGRLTAGQVVVSGGARKVPWTVGTGFFRFEGEEGSRLLRNGNGERDYSLGVLAIRAVPALGGHPLRLAVEWMHNFEGYEADDPHPFTAANFEQTDGFALSVEWRDTQASGDWGVGYAYARIEALAVHASYAQDDWVRWGSATQTDSSDFRGHELRWSYVFGKKVFGKNVGLVARLFVAESLTSPQDGRRARVDLNYKF